MADALTRAGRPTPIVSIIIPVYNDEKHVADAIESALNQTMKEVEVIVVDDGSTDGTPGVLKRYEGRIKIIRQENKGPGAARNAGIKASRGRYICFLDADDTFMPEKVEAQATFLESRKEVGLCFSRFVRILERAGDRKVRRISVPEDNDWAQAIVENMLLHLDAMLFRKEWLEKVGMFDERLLTNQDRDLLCRLALAGCKFGGTDHIVAVRVERENSWSMDPERQLRGRLLLLDKYYSDPRRSEEDPVRRAKVYCDVWLQAAMGRLRLGNTEGASRAWAKALMIDPLAFRKASTWSRPIRNVAPFCANPGHQRFSSLRSIHDQLFQAFEEACRLHSRLRETGSHRQELCALRAGLAKYAFREGNAWGARLWLFRSLATSPTTFFGDSHVRAVAKVILGPRLTRWLSWLKRRLRPAREDHCWGDTEYIRRKR